MPISPFPARRPAVPATRRRSAGASRFSQLSRALACLSVLALLSACATSHNARNEAAQYRRSAHGDYTPPGPPEDPWGPYISEASKRFDVPQPWIRQVMKVESGGHQYLGGELTTSGAGAMGLMQIMPDTYDELRARYGLGDDPYNPRDNIMAGTAYIREMYDLYGSPGFLAAYNAGPARLDDYLTRNRPLPAETRRYVAMIGPYIADSFPDHRSPAEQTAMNALPIDIPPGPRYPRGRRPVQLASAGRHPPEPPARAPVQVAQLPAPPRAEPAPQQVALALPPPAPHGGFRLVPAAMADTLPMRSVSAAHSSGAWAIQVGAFSNESLARNAAGEARGKAGPVAGHAQLAVTTVQTGHAKLYRARLTGLSREAANQACERIAHGGRGCIVLSPDAQS